MQRRETRELKELMREIEAKWQVPAAAPPATNVVVIHETGCFYDPRDRTLYFGTSHGDLIVRFDDAETIMDDITAWLKKTGQQRPVSPATVAAVLRRLKGTPS